MLHPAPFDCRVALLLGLLSCLAPPAASQSRMVADPVRSFVNGFNPTGEDFFARADSETVLLRMRLDMDGDRCPDVALSESSVVGAGGGPWLLFRRLSGGGYHYLGEVFAAPGGLRTAPPDSGGPELIAGSMLSADLTRVVRYRVATDSIVKLSERHTSGSSGLPPGARTESCRLVDYRQGASRCWHPGWAKD